ncbi:hypothetical protein LINPERHAP1_LOCUS25063, partial [Linum perenne]
IFGCLLPPLISLISLFSIQIFFSYNLQKNYEQKSKPRCLPFQAAAVVVDQVPLCLSLAGAASADCFFSSRRRGSKPSPPSSCGPACRLPPYRSFAVTVSTPPKAAVVRRSSDG